MSELATTVEPGWRPDPSGRFEWRYWDGGWTNRVANTVPPNAQPGAPATAPATAPAPTAPANPAPAPASLGRPAPSSAPAPVGQSSWPSTWPGNSPEPPPAASAVPPAAVTVTAAAVAAPAALRQPFGAATPAAAMPPTPAQPARSRPTPWAWLVGFFRSFADQPESYQSPHSAHMPPPDPRDQHVVAAPGNYGAAGLVALAACGVAAGAYLPWLTWSADGITFQQTGVDFGHFSGYALGAAALALSALLSVQIRKLRWLAMGLTLAMAGFVVRDLLDSYDQMQQMNAGTGVDANLSMGLMIMVVSAAIAMIAAVRLTEREKIV